MTEKAEGHFPAIEARLKELVAAEVKSLELAWMFDESLVITPETVTVYFMSLAHAVYALRDEDVTGPPTITGQPSSNPLS